MSPKPSLLSRTKALLTPRTSTASVPQQQQQQQQQEQQQRGPHHFQRAPTSTSLFPPVDDDDDPDCRSDHHDCQTCELSYPNGFKIDETEALYGRVNGWGWHMLVATGRSDWVRDVADEKGSLMEAMRDVLLAIAKRKRGKKEGKKEGKEGEKEEEGGAGWMVSASNMPVPEEGGERGATRVLLLPSWVVVDGVTPAGMAGLVERVVEGGVANTTPLEGAGRREVLPAVRDEDDGTGKDTRRSVEEEEEEEKPELGNGTTLQQQQQQQDLQTAQAAPTATSPSPSPPPSSSFDTRPCPHNYLILLCSHRTRDARCGQSAPLLRKEFERQLRPLGLYRDLHDERPGGVGIYFINHVGGHKFSANVLVYRRAAAAKEDGGGGGGEASQCIWLARVRPEDCEGIVKFTVLQGQVVKPQRQLRGGFDREKGLVSW